jgi:hypothetical protein
MDNGKAQAKAVTNLAALKDFWQPGTASGNIIPYTTRN